MSFQAYLDAIKAKTGKGPDDFRALAAEKGLVGPQAKAAEVVAWLKDDFGLGRGHAMAIYALLKSGGAPRAPVSDRVDKHFSGGKAVWRGPFEEMLARVQAFGSDVALAPTDSYISLVRGKKKFAIVQTAAGHMDIGVKCKGVEATDRFTSAEGWNAMVTHRTRISAGSEIDAELADWLRRAYDSVG
jgi:hypothetical protein